ncbi:hypothetical protein [Gallaecimonas xiamenensis]|uniref:Uncharacterized protein n=1 Tax=Gallaecimonas xiamenensis 3-C-1 TaxID=745411 RepID=K2JA58_9GAMM|nr:hypothetical protein [Gallaecimonas xiamenensis]EKE71682.1 hypothetical protein B3C1_12124 [Gallaecimonas xiamenensis 3-C-1]
MARLFLIPLALCILWYLVMNHFQIPFERGRKGFYWIIGLSAFLIGFLSLMLHLTASS